MKAEAASKLGILLTDADIATSVPLLAADDYGNFFAGANGYAQVRVNITIVDDTTGALISTVSGVFHAEGVSGGLDIQNLVTGDVTGFTPAVLPPGQEYSVTVVRTGHAFLNDIAHTAAPVFSAPGVLAPDGDSAVGYSGPFNGQGQNTQYDNELLDAHFIAGDGRVNENIGLTAVHAVFHSEHNRLVEHTKDVALADAQELLAGGASQAVAVAFLNEWLSDDVTSISALTTKEDLTWDGERLFQAAKFGTEMQYQHLVFEEFARRVQPQVDAFLAPTGFDTTINPAIFAEFAHTVYRFGHSMLTETIDRFDPNFNVIDADPLHPAQDASGHQIGLIAAFLNPLAFTASDQVGTVGDSSAAAVGAIVRGVARQSGNAIDEFVTEALRNNLVGLPLDLPAINIARGRDTGVPSLNEARKQFYAMTSDSQLKPYTSWVDFSRNIKHVESMVNFIAAYGTHSSVLLATTAAEKRAAAYALVYGQGGMDGIVLDDPTTPTRQ